MLIERFLNAVDRAFSKESVQIPDPSGLPVVPRLVVRSPTAHASTMTHGPERRVLGERRSLVERRLGQRRRLTEGPQCERRHVPLRRLAQRRLAQCW